MTESPIAMTNEPVRHRVKRQYDASFKARVAIAAIRSDKTLTVLSDYFGVHPSQISEWKRQLLSRAAMVFEHNRPRSGK
jgi:transposase-like protein